MRNSRLGLHLHLAAAMAAVAASYGDGAILRQTLARPDDKRDPEPFDPMGGTCTSAPPSEPKVTREMQRRLRQMDRLRAKGRACR